LIKGNHDRRFCGSQNDSGFGRKALSSVSYAMDACLTINSCLNAAFKAFDRAGFFDALHEVRSIENSND
ncbi:hypothetical protein, partial [Paracoccus pacificus]